MNDTTRLILFIISYMFGVIFCGVETSLYNEFKNKKSFSLGDILLCVFPYCNLIIGWFYYFYMKRKER